jgi:phenylacetate-CoA ligase
MEPPPKPAAAPPPIDDVRRQLRYGYERSPLYRRKFDALGVLPEDIRTWDDFRRLPPLLTKEDQRASQEASRRSSGDALGEHLCCDPADVAYVCSTSGTTGAPTFTPYTARDLATTDETWFRVFAHVGLRAGDVAANLHGLSMTGLGIPLLHALKRFGAVVAPIGAVARSTRILHYLDALRPRAIFATPALVEYLADRAPDTLGKPVGELGVEVIVCTGAPGAGIAEIRQRICTAFGARLYDAAGGSQGIHNVSCDAEPYQGMHVLTPDLGIWSEDLVDPATGEPVAMRDGAVGEGLLTGLRQQASPALKCAFGDVLQVLTSPCPCGRPGPRIRIVGRTDDMLNVLGVNLHPVAVWDVVRRWTPETTGHMRVVLDEPGPAVRPPVRLVVERGHQVPPDAWAGLARRLEDDIHARLRVRTSVELVAPDTLERAGGPATKGALVERRYEARSPA